MPFDTTVYSFLVVPDTSFVPTGKSAGIFAAVLFVNVYMLSLSATTEAELLTPCAAMRFGVTVMLLEAGLIDALNERLSPTESVPKPRTPSLPPGKVITT